MAYKPYSLQDRERFINLSSQYSNLELAKTRNRIGYTARSIGRTLNISTFGAPPAGATKVIDMSHWNNEAQPDNRVDFAKIYNAGYRGVWIKLTEGDGYVDPYGSQNWYGALEAGLIPGGYHFFLDYLKGDVQYDHFMSVIEPLIIISDDVYLPPMGDFEYITKTITNVQRCNRAGGLLSLMQSGLRKPTMYSSAYIWNTFFGNCGWEGNYYNTPAHWTTASEPLLPSSWSSDMTISWQNCVCPKYGWCDPCPFDLDGGWDLQIAYGDEEWLWNLSGGSVTPPPSGDCCEELQNQINAMNDRLDYVEGTLEHHRLGM